MLSEWALGEDSRAQHDIFPARAGSAGVDIPLLVYLSIVVTLKRCMSKTPYLIHDTDKAPHIHGSGVLVIVDGLVRKLRVTIHPMHASLWIHFLPQELSISLALFLHERHSISHPSAYEIFRSY